MQVQTYKTAMVGEHAAISMTIHAGSDCPAQQGWVSASYADGGEPPLLCSSPASGDGKISKPALERIHIQNYHKA